MADDDKPNKATFPTSKLSIFCDTFDEELVANLHETEEGERKLKISIGDKEVSLYQEDAYALLQYLRTFDPHLRPRNIRVPLDSRAW